MNKDRVNQPKNEDFSNQTSKDRNQDRDQNRPTGGHRDFDQGAANKQKDDVNKTTTRGSEGR